jgi:hypothetical protein
MLQRKQNRDWCPEFVFQGYILLCWTSREGVCEAVTMHRDSTKGRGSAMLLPAGRAIPDVGEKGDTLGAFEKQQEGSG